MVAAKKFFKNRGINIDFSCGLEKSVEEWRKQAWPAAASFSYVNTGEVRRVEYTSSTGNTLAHVYENSFVIFSLAENPAHFIKLIDEVRAAFLSNSSFSIHLPDRCSKDGNIEEFLSATYFPEKWKVRLEETKYGTPPPIVHGIVVSEK